MITKGGWIVIMVLLFPLTATAQVSGALRDYFDSLGGMTTGTGAQRTASQSAGLYTLGSVHLRTPVKRVTPASIQFPSARAGCGGIDLFAGSFSILDDDELVALGKAIASNATAMAFDIALETELPLIAQTMARFRNMAMSLNQFNINSCEAAAGLVGSVWSKTAASERVICEQLGASSGFFTDAAAAKHGCGSRGQRATTLKNAPAEYADVLPTNTNLTWQALGKSRLDLDDAQDRELAEMVMTLVGTVIRTGASDDDSSSAMSVWQGMSDNGSLMGAFLDGGEVLMYRCNADPDNRCLEPRGVVETITGTGAFNSRIRTLLVSMSDKVSRNTGALSEQELWLLNMTRLPLYKMINVNAAYSRGGDFVDVPGYAEVIALDVLTAFLQELLGTLDGPALALAGLDEATRTQFTASVREARIRVYERQNRHTDQVAMAMGLVERTRMLEGVLAGQLTARLARNPLQQGRATR